MVIMRVMCFYFCLPPPPPSFRSIGFCGRVGVDDDVYVGVFMLPSRKPDEALSGSHLATTGLDARNR